MCVCVCVCAQVTLAEAVPVPGSGLTLPLDLFHIAARCNGAYFASKRFAAVQLAYTHPRCRVLVFHTGRLVGTGAFCYTSLSLHSLSLSDSRVHVSQQAAPDPWPHDLPSHAHSGSSPRTPACTSIRATSLL